MTIRIRIILLVILTSLVTMGVTWLLFREVIHDEFAAIERDQVNQDMDRVLNAIENLQEQLVIQTEDWSKWDDTYTYMADKNKGYLKAVLNYESLATLKMRHVFYWKEGGKVFDAHQVDDEKEKLIPPDAASVAAIGRESKLFTYDGPNTVNTGLVAIDAERVVLAAASPIQDSAREESSRGILAFTQELNQTLVEKIAKQTKSSLKFFRIDSKNAESSILNISAQIAANGRTVQEVKNDAEIRAYQLLKDIRGTPLLLVELDSARPVYQQGINFRSLATYLLSISAMLTVLVMYCGMRFWIVKPLRDFLSQLRALIRTSNASGRIQMPGEHELAQIARKVNDLLVVLDESRKETEAARDMAQTANDAKSSFIAKVSHELRTPIHSIMGMQRILLKEEKSRALKSYIRMAQESAEGLLTTINEILDFSKVESGNLTVERIPFEIRDVVRETMRLISGRVTDREELEVACSIDPSVPRVLEGDPTRLKQLLVNLLGNSIKFTKNGAVLLKVSIVDRLEGDAILSMAVTDTGIGIPASKLDSIFEPFKQADDTVTRNYQGTGLGLTLVRQFCWAMRGDVTVESEVGVGTTFTATVRLPVVEAHFQLSSEPLPWKQVLLVGPDSVTTATLSAALERFGLSCVRLNSSEDADLARLHRAFEMCGAMIVTSEALGRSRVFDCIVESVNTSPKPIIPLLRASEVSLRERLLALGLKQILAIPVLPEDVVLSALTKLGAEDTHWEDTGESLLASDWKIRVLVADDAPTNRLILENMLTEVGHEVLCVHDGTEVVKIATKIIEGDPKAEHIDVILTDIQMPLMDGFTATKLIRELEARNGGTTRIPIIAVTAHAMSEEQEHMRAAGVDAVVTKPIELKALAEALELVTRASRATQLESGKAPDPRPQTVVIESELDLEVEAERIWRQLRVENDPSNPIPFPGQGPDLTVTSLIDLNDVYDRSGNSLPRTIKIFKAFNGCFREQLARLAKGKGESDLESLKMASHALKGILLDVGATKTAALAGAVERCCKEERLEQATKSVSALTEQTLLVARILERLCENVETEGAPKGTRQTDRIAKD